MSVLAHGVGSRHDLPLPLDLVLQGAAVALLASFLALGLLWTKPRFTPLVLPEPAGRWIVRAVVAAGLPFVPGAAWPHVVFVLLWVGFAVLSMLFGPVWRVLNPLRLVVLVARGRRYPERLGHWPAAVTLLAFTWVELVEPHALPWFLVGYAALNLAGGWVFGASWFANADGFEVYSSLLGRLSPVRGNPFRVLAATPPAPGLVAVVAVCLGSTAFDSIGGTPTWARLSPVPDWLGLVLTVLLVAGSYQLATRGFAAALAPTLVPIVAGYVVAHYYSLLVVEGQRAAALLLRIDLTPDETLVAPLVVSSVQIGAVLVGHLLGVVAAHDRTLGLLPKADQVTAQVPLLVLMVVYTAGGLALLFAP